MPKKNLAPAEVPSIVLERLRDWGSFIKKLRITQKLRVQDLCTRMGITHTTLRRIERGDPGAGAGLYLSALMVLGAIDIAAPPLLKDRIDLPNANRRVRIANAKDNDHDF